MIKKRFGKTGWQVSAIGLGCWNIGNQWGEMTDSQAEEIIKAGYDNGLNMYDVAESYGIPNGLSEIRLGKALEGIRNKVFVTSKIGHWGKRTGQEVPKTTVDMIRVCGHACAGRLRTEYIDVMLCHEDNIGDPSIYIEGFKALKNEGFIREYGISTNNYEVFKNFYNVSDGECSVLELDYSLLNKEPEIDFLPFCKEHDIAILARGSMAMGLLSGRYDENTVFTDSVRSSWNKGEPNRDKFIRNIEKVNGILNLISINEISDIALQYVISNGENIVAIPGATKTSQVLSNVIAGNSFLDADMLNVLKRIE